MTAFEFKQKQTFGEDSLALKFAPSVATAGYQPDPVWVLDICLTADGGYHLLENAVLASLVSMAVTMMRSFEPFRQWRSQFTLQRRVTNAFEKSGLRGFTNGQSTFPTQRASG